LGRGGGREFINGNCVFLFCVITIIVIIVITIIIIVIIVIVIIIIIIISIIVINIIIGIIIDVVIAIVIDGSGSRSSSSSSRAKYVLAINTSCRRFLGDWQRESKDCCRRCRPDNFATYSCKGDTAHLSTTTYTRELTVLIRAHTFQRTY
jgi:hypothetical protein